MQGSHDFYNNDLDFNNSIFETFLSYYSVNLLYYLINNNKRFILLVKKHSILRIVNNKLDWSHQIDHVKAKAYAAFG